MAQALSESQALELLKSPPNRDEIAHGNDYQSGLRVFTLPLFDRDLLKEKAWLRFRETLKKRLTAEKYKAIANQYSFPLSIVNLSEDLMLDLYKVFDGRDASFSVSYPEGNSRAKELGDAVLSELNVRRWIEDEGKKVLKCAPNTVVVLDKDEEGNPLVLAIPNERIYGYIADKEGNFEIFMFVHSKGVDENKRPWTKYAYYDAESYRVWEEKEGNWSLLTANPHTLGSCPARFFYNQPRVDKHRFDRAIPLTPVMGVMEDWQELELFDTYQWKHSAFQTVEYALNPCENDNCTDGIISVDAVVGEGGEVLQKEYQAQCQTCAKNAFMGPGTAIGIEVGVDKDDMDIRGVLRYVAPIVESLKAAGEKNDSRKTEIKESVVGYSDAITSEAINPVQIGALVESRKQPLFAIKHHLEELYKWIVKGVMKLTYDIPVSVHANYGTEFFILTTEDIAKIIVLLKEAGVQSSVIAEFNRMLVATKYKSDPEKVERMLIAADLEPNAYDSIEEARKKFMEKSMNPMDYFIKANFTSLLREFEIRNGDIVTYGSDILYKDKIKAIKETLIEYVNQKNITQEDEDNTEQVKGSQAGVS